MSRPRLGSASKETEEKCKTCDLKVSRKDKGIQCEICQGWWHCRCVNINEEAYEILNLENIHWFRSACNFGMGRILLTLTKLVLKQSKLEGEMKIITVDVSDTKSKNEKTDIVLENMKSHNSKLAEDINKMKMEIDKQFVRMVEELTDVRCKMADTKSDMQKLDDKFSCEEDDGSDNTWVKVAGKHVDTKLVQVASEVQTMQKALQDTRDAAREVQDKETRRNNIIMYRVPESDALLGGDRLKCGK